MSDWQRPEQLLEIALDALRREILPNLEGDIRYTGLMVANAIAIAQRQCLAEAEACDPDTGSNVHALAPHLPASSRTSEAGVADAVSVSARVLVDAIRAGTADPGQPLHEPLRTYLDGQCRSALAISNPRYLGTR